MPSLSGLIECCNAQNHIMPIISSLISSRFSSAWRLLGLMTLAIAVTACDAPEIDSTIDESRPIVKTVAAQVAIDPQLVLSGTIQAVRQNPISFQVGGRIDRRLVQAGDVVTPGQTLFTLDPRDLEQALTLAQAEVSAAQSSVKTTQDELQRSQSLSKSGFISQQALDRVEQIAQESQTRLDAALARAQQARFAVDYATLKAQDHGIVTETLAEVGQVVTPGLAVALFAQAGPIDIEVFLPQGLKAPASGVVSSGNQRWQASLREVAGAADRASRTIRTRYTLLGQDTALPIGSVAQLTITTGEPGQNVIRVPLGALDERGQGAQVWIVVDGLTQAVPVQVLSLSTENAQVQSTLAPGAPVIAMGTHLIQPGMAVKVQPGPAP